MRLGRSARQPHRRTPGEIRHREKAETLNRFCAEPHFCESFFLFGLSWRSNRGLSSIVDRVFLIEPHSSCLSRRPPRRVDRLAATVRLALSLRLDPRTRSPELSPVLVPNTLATIRPTLRLALFNARAQPSSASCGRSTRAQPAAPSRRAECGRGAWLREERNEDFFLFSLRTCPPPASLFAAPANREARRGPRTPAGIAACGRSRRIRGLRVRSPRMRRSLPMRRSCPRRPVISRPVALSVPACAARPRGSRAQPARIRHRGTPRCTVDRHRRRFKPPFTRSRVGASRGLFAATRVQPRYRPSDT